MTQKKRTPLDPFIPLHVRAFIQSQDPYEMAVIAALQFWHWWYGDKGELGTKGVALLARMSDAKARQVLKSLKDRGWVESSRGFGSKSRYALTIPMMSWPDAKKAASNWIPKLQSDDPQLAFSWRNDESQSATTKRSIRHEVANRALPHSELILDSDSIQTHTEKGAKNAPTPSEGKPNPWADLMEVFKEHGVEVLHKDPRQIGLIQNLGKKIGQDVFKRLVVEYCLDQFCVKGGRSVNGFLKNADRLLDRATYKSKMNKKIDPLTCKHKLGTERKETSGGIFTRCLGCKTWVRDIEAEINRG